jgi:hypothetical protein
VAYAEPIVEVVDASRSGDVTTTRVRLVAGGLPSEPIAPAGLYAEEHDDEQLFELHTLRHWEPGGLLVFESYGDAAAVRPGERAVFRSRWTRESWWAATDRNLQWELAVYHGDGHDHCLLTWETIARGDTAYRSSRGNWVTVGAYERYIRDDVLRLRA